MDPVSASPWRWKAVAFESLGSPFLGDDMSSASFFLRRCIYIPSGPARPRRNNGDYPVWVPLAINPAFDHKVNECQVYCAYTSGSVRQ